MPKETRLERDSMGELPVPAEALYGAQTQRALLNFPETGLTMPRLFLKSLALIKWAAAKTNAKLGLLDPNIAQAIQNAAYTIYEGHHLDTDFPVDVFQTGSGTSSNMNMNEVIASLASKASQQSIHPNDAVNLGQSSNDVIPTAIHVSVAMSSRETLFPAIHELISIIDKKRAKYKTVVKTGRTHLMDAMPLTLDQEMSAWSSQLTKGLTRLNNNLHYIQDLAIGGTAVGTGINTHPEFGPEVARLLSTKTGIPFKPNTNLFEALSAQDAVLAYAGQLRVLACTLTKIAEDLRLMNSGPIAGFSEIQLPAIQPGSSIMPGKVNPVIPESVLMICAQVMGNDLSLNLAAQSGRFQLNVMLPLIAYQLLQSIQLLSQACLQLGRKAIEGFIVNEKHIKSELSRNPILVTALNPILGYELGAKIAKTAYESQRPLEEVAKALSSLSDQELKTLLDPYLLTQGGISSMAEKKQKNRG